MQNVIVKVLLTAFGILTLAGGLVVLHLAPWNTRTTIGVTLLVIGWRVLH